jgi:hypothetical protein
MPSASRLLAEGPVHTGMFRNGDWGRRREGMNLEARR